MNDKEELNTSLIDEYSIPISKRNCCFYLFCCCFCFSDSKPDSRNYYISKWRKYLAKETDLKKNLNPFRVLTNLWAHKNVIKDLEQIRLNPNLLNKKNIRNDLEFYIPQLCTFLLFGEYERVEEFLAFLCKACFASFSFAHRITWFLKSLMNPYNTNNDRIRTILHLIQTIFKSENKNYMLERLHVAGSKKFIEYLHKTRLYLIYENYYFNNKKLPDNYDNEELQSRIERRKQVREMLDRYIDHQYNEILGYNPVINLDSNSIYNCDIKNSDFINLKATEDNLQNNKLFNNNLVKSNSSSMIKLECDDVFISTFKRYDSVTNDENNILTQYIKQIDIDDTNLSSFLSNINFIDHLCNICEILRSTQDSEQIKILLNELKKVNKILPANVYLPFLKDSIRNYVLASIPLSEVKILKTKNRAPYMITLECFRLDELTYNLIRKYGDVSVSLDETCRSRKSSSSSLNEEDKTIKTLADSSGNIKSKKARLSNKDFDMVKSQSYVDSLLNTSTAKNKDINIGIETLNKSDEIIENPNRRKKSDFDCYTQIKDKKAKIEISPKNSLNTQQKKRMSNLDRKLSELNYLIESDISISKPLLIKNILSANLVSSKNNSPKKKLKQRHSLNPLKKNKKKILTDYEDIDYETDPEDYLKIEEVVKSNAPNVNVKNNTIVNEIPDNNTSRTVVFKELDDHEEIMFKKDSKDEENRKNIKVDAKLIKEKENKMDTNGNTNFLEDNSFRQQNFGFNFNDSSKDIIFGEKIEEQTERLKKTSPFSFLSTYKLFKVIIKSGEDLRQEQFATQLINEFLQIFKLEKVDCWVNPYEILATGNNVGIIEVVPNTISLDQLKRKGNLTSLKSFYETYFAPVNSDRYKSAMDNFISSLAGYSLVCYFLKIKDRHNANILIDNQGHLIHIDFGFILSNAPGKGLQFEKAPFKLTKEFVDVVGGVNSKHFTKFRKLLWKGFIAIVNNYEKILILVEMMYCGHGNKLPCFEKGHIAIEELRQRFIPRPNMKNRDYIEHVDSLIEQSIDNWRTKWYDKYQYWVQGIFY